MTESTLRGPHRIPRAPPAVEGGEVNQVPRGGPPPECLNALQATTRRAPAAGTAVNIDIDIDIDSMFDDFFSRLLVLDYLIDTVVVDLWCF